MEIQKKVEKLEKLMDISIYLGSTLKLSELLRRIISSCQEIFNSEEASIILYDNKKEELYFYQALNESDEAALKKIILKKGQGIAGYVAETRQKLIVNDAQTDPRHDKRADRSTGKTTRNLMALPIVSQDRLIGIMEVINKIREDFTQEDLREAESLANIAGVALENAKLHEETKDNLKKIQELEHAKTEFISILSHELYTPLTSICGYTELILKRLNNIDIDTLKESLKVVKCQGIHLNMLITDLFIVNKMSDMENQIAMGEDIENYLNFKEMDIRDIIKEKVEYWNTEKETHHIIFETKGENKEDDFKLKIDHQKLGHGLYHLLDNACKFSDMGSTINIGLSIINIKDKKFIQIVVEDFGIGIDKEYHEKIFNKFFQISSGMSRTHDGLGTGLFVCKKIVEAHGGKIFCESESGKGSKFFIQLPSENYLEREKL